MSQSSSRRQRLIPAIVAGTGHRLRVLVPALRARGFEVGASSAIPIATFADGVASMEVIDAMRVSSASGGAQVSIA